MALQQLQQCGTTVIADTADFEKIAKFNASEGTTNPSLLNVAAQSPQYSALVQAAIKYANSLPGSPTTSEKLTAAVDHLAVQFGKEIQQLTGKVSTEVDVTLSFDTAATVASALRIIDLYKAQGVAKESVRIKISATWEGIQAARILQRDHEISCLVTMVFGIAQAVAAAEAGADAIAPYVGRIGDWGKLHGAEGDLGVTRVRQIQNHLRKYGFKTKVMAASFRNVGQVTELAGIDLLTASPEILDAVEKEAPQIVAQLTSQSAQASECEHLSFLEDEAKFRWAFNHDACAVEKSAEAMRKFAEDTEKLKSFLATKLD